MPDPFPSELVEAAAKAAMEAEPGQNWECATAKEADVYLRDSLAVLAVVVPLIEQRVIDRLAREAGEPERHVVWLCAGCDVCHPPDGSPREQRYPCAPDGGSPSCGGALVVLAEDAERWVACGVAAERARTREIITAYGSPDGFVQKASLLAALAPERTREGNDA